MDNIGTNHCLIGNLLAKDWKFSIEIQESIKFHHKEVKNDQPGSISGILKISHYLVDRLNYRALPNVQNHLSQPLMVHIKDNLEEYKSLTQSLPVEMQKAKEVYQID